MMPLKTIVIVVIFNIYLPLFQKKKEACMELNILFSSDQNTKGGVLYLDFYDILKIVMEFKSLEVFN